jgi:xanthosine utilization system XapX-like protein
VSVGESAPDTPVVMDTGFMIKVTIVLTWAIIACAGFNVGRFYDLVVQGWPALAALLGIMIGGKTMERVKELHGTYFGTSSPKAEGGDK